MCNYIIDYYGSKKALEVAWDNYYGGPSSIFKIKRVLFLNHICFLSKASVLNLIHAIRIPQFMNMCDGLDSRKNCGN
jgi:hypothetical protein